MRIVTGFVIGLLPAFFDNSLKTLMLIYYSILGAINIIYGFNIRGLKEGVRNKIKAKVITYFTRKS